MNTFKNQVLCIERLYGSLNWILTFVLFVCIHICTYLYIPFQPHVYSFHISPLTKEEWGQNLRHLRHCSSRVSVHRPRQVFLWLDALRHALAAENLPTCHGCFGRKYWPATWQSKRLEKSGKKSVVSLAELVFFHLFSPCSRQGTAGRFADTASETSLRPSPSLLIAPAWWATPGRRFFGAPPPRPPPPWRMMLRRRTWRCMRSGLMRCFGQDGCFMMFWHILASHFGFVPVSTCWFSWIKLWYHHVPSSVGIRYDVNITTAQEVRHWASHNPRQRSDLLAQAFDQCHMYTHSVWYALMLLSDEAGPWNRQ